jgi:conjugal transfer pilus assembly protein TraW
VNPLVSPTRRARLVMAFQGATIAGLLLASALIAGSARSAALPGSTSATTTIGRTWPIAEPDAMSEIEAKAATLPANMAARFGPRSSWSAMRAAALTPATADRVRSVIPFYTLPFDITLPDGKRLYPRGYTFNPLAYVSLPQRLVVIHPRDLGWALRTARATDFILLTAGDAIELTEKTGRPMYILEEQVKERLNLTVAPVIVAQAGQKLVLTEVGPAARGARPGAAGMRKVAKR